MNRLLATGDFSDFTITCGGIDFKVHRAVICYASAYFKKACHGAFQVCYLGSLLKYIITDIASGERNKTSYLARARPCNPCLYPGLHLHQQIPSLRGLQATRSSCCDGCCAFSSPAISAHLFFAQSHQLQKTKLVNSFKGLSCCRLLSLELPEGLLSRHHDQRPA